ncbi:hypothetical protein Syun_016944 [Stephania yunnanensis]|uniref:Uncharacterized protein n=1 Tax=Stephania yunnanensis TaxID=152371 RepID=A0AAP0J8C8_9MAGN
MRAEAVVIGSGEEDGGDPRWLTMADRDEGADCPPRPLIRVLNNTLRICDKVLEVRALESLNLRDRQKERHKKSYKYLIYSSAYQVKIVRLLALVKSGKGNLGLIRVSGRPRQDCEGGSTAHINGFKRLEQLGELDKYTADMCQLKMSLLLQLSHHRFKPHDLLFLQFHQFLLGEVYQSTAKVNSNLGETIVQRLDKQNCESLVIEQVGALTIINITGRSNERYDYGMEKLPSLELLFDIRHAFVVHTKGAASVPATRDANEQTKIWEFMWARILRQIDGVCARKRLLSESFLDCITEPNEKLEEFRFGESAMFVLVG